MYSLDLLLGMDADRFAVVGKNHHHERHRRRSDAARHHLHPLDQLALDVGHPELSDLGIQVVPEGPHNATNDGNHDKDWDLENQSTVDISSIVTTTALFSPQHFPKSTPYSMNLEL